MMKKRKILVAIMISIVLLLSFYIYNNQFYAHRVVQAIKEQNITKLEKLMNNPFGNLNCKPAIWIYEVLSEQDSSTPLQTACELGSLQIVSILLENGADVNYTHWDELRDQGSALVNAAASLSDERLSVIRLLLENGADISYETYTGNDAFSCSVYACQEQSDTIEIIECLEQAGGNIHKKYPDDENSLLHKACESDSLIVIQYLIEQRGFDINAVNANGDTPLIYFLRFASARKKETMLFLLQNGADTTIKNNEGKTAYDYAVERHPELVDLFAGQGDVVPSVGEQDRGRFSVLTSRTGDGSLS